MLTYPFTAVVGSYDMALAVCALSAAIGGAPGRGPTGTATSTMLRGLAALRPAVDVLDPACPDVGHHARSAALRPARLVELPVGATGDRVIGPLHLQKALSAWGTAYAPGLLAAAHRGLLSLQEVNSVHEHLLDLLLGQRGIEW